MSQHFVTSLPAVLLESQLRICSDEARIGDPAAYIKKRSLGPGGKLVISKKKGGFPNQKGSCSEVSEAHSFSNCCRTVF